MLAALHELPSNLPPENCTDPRLIQFSVRLALGRAAGGWQGAVFYE